MRLTKRQREQLLELADVRDKGSTGEAYFYPTGSEFKTADALTRAGLLARVRRAYMLTDSGYAEARRGN